MEGRVTDADEESLVVEATSVNAEDREADALGPGSLLVIDTGGPGVSVSGLARSGWWNLLALVVPALLVLYAVGQPST